MQKFRWGIIGAGGIAGKFTEALQQNPEAVLSGIASRSEDKRNYFKNHYGFLRTFATYEELCSCPDIDIIYVATPHNFHCEHSLLAINMGKHVLCEKPFSLNEREARTMIQAAKKQSVFLMEAMWIRFFPSLQKLREFIDGGIIGNITSIEANFGFKGDPSYSPRLYEPNLGGGALMDVGIYPITLANLLLGTPSTLSAKATKSVKGIDLNSSYHLSYKNGATADLYSSIENETSCSAAIHGDKGSISLPKPWWHFREIIIQTDKAVTIDCSYTEHDFAFQLKEVHTCLKKELLESPSMPHQTTLDMMQLMDALRHKIGLIFPSDESF